MKKFARIFSIVFICAFAAPVITTPVVAQAQPANPWGGPAKKTPQLPPKSAAPAAPAGPAKPRVIVQTPSKEEPKPEKCQYGADEEGVCYESLEEAFIAFSEKQEEIGARDEHETIVYFGILFAFLLVVAAIAMHFRTMARLNLFAAAVAKNLQRIEALEGKEPTRLFDPPKPVANSGASAPATAGSPPPDQYIPPTPPPA
ncbi:hypothetical protein JXD20_02335 [Candidatus Peregrinibacteria bacterium]|nr:hypothetical protein [Candidatus Peregrinibacteria bacterium]